MYRDEDGDVWAVEYTHLGCKVRTCIQHQTHGLVEHVTLSCREDAAANRHRAVRSDHALTARDFFDN